MTHDATRDAGRLAQDALRRAQPLTGFQRSMLEVQLCQPTACVLNLPMIFSMPRASIDVERFVQAMRETVDRYPIFRTVLEFDGQGRVVQRYEPRLRYELAVQEVSDEEFEALRPTLNRPMRLFGASLVDLRLYVAQTSVHMLLSAHHVALEATSINVLVESIVRLYEGKEGLAPDTFYAFLDEAGQGEGRPGLAQARAYFEREYGQTAWCCNLKPDYVSDDLSSASFRFIAPVTPEDLRRLRDSLGISPTEFCAQAALMALSEVEGERDVRLSWVYQNRANPAYRDAAGMLIALLPLGVTMDDDVAKVAAQLHERSRAARPHSAYEWCFEHERLFESDALFLVYEGPLLDMDAMRRMQAQMSVPPSPTHTVLRRTSLQLVQLPQGLLFKFIYARSLYSEEHVNAYKEALLRSIERLVQFSQEGTS